MASSKITTVRRRKIPKWKIEEVQLLKDLILKHDTIAVADLTNIGSYQLYLIRKALRGKAILRVSKNTLMKIAIKEVSNEKPGLEKLIDYLKGQNIFIFTNMNPFELQRVLEKNKVSRPARAGDIAPEDIVVPAGNTGIPPGPIMSKFSEFKVPVRIEEGSIVIIRDTVVAKKGEKINADLAELLNKLGIEPIKVGLELKAAYVDGLIIPGEELKVNPEEYFKLITEAHRHAVALAIEACYPVGEVIQVIIQRAHLQALSLAGNVALPIPDGIRLALQKAIAEANVVSSLIAPKCPELGLAVAKVEKVEEEKKEEEKKEEKGEEKGEEEEIAAGLAGLFG
ncbi:MAG: 50S ribosomal protein L10 [Thermoprotei archaeon]|nr:MAG: 50S ribosomal protein L10 [Thermoprotei archaeon]RLF19216.1 MAG: 50S ribosomal protein L10 [Thermoprotei archaeon]